MPAAFGSSLCLAGTPMTFAKLAPIIAAGLFLLSAISLAMAFGIALEAVGPYDSK